MDGIFVSHSHHDTEWCRDFVAKLRETEQEVWYDEHDLTHGSLSERIVAAIESHWFFIVVLSPHAVESAWVRKEFGIALDYYKRQRNRLILPVVASKCEIPKELKELSDFKWISRRDNGGQPAIEAAKKTLQEIASERGERSVHGSTRDAIQQALTKGRELRARSLLYDALQAFEEALALDKRSVFTWIEKGLTCHRLGLYDDALSAYDRARVIDPSNPVIWFNQGCALDKLGRFEDAVDAYRHALDHDPRSQDTWNNLGQAYERLDQLEDALAAYDHALELDPKFTIAWKNRASLIARMG